MAKPRFVPSTTAAALKTWAAQKRRLLIERNEPVACTLGRLRHERVAAGEGDPLSRQRWAEVYTGDGLIIQSIVCTLTDLPRLVLTFHWICRWPWAVPIQAQASEIGISKRDYFVQLQIAEVAVNTGLQLITGHKRLSA